MAKCIFTLVDSATNQVIAENKSYRKLYEYTKSMMSTPTSLGRKVKIMKNTEDSVPSLVYELISVKDKSGRIHMNNMEAYNRIQQRARANRK